MSIATVVTRGYGSFGTIPLVVTAGYSIGAQVVSGPTLVQGSDAVAGGPTASDARSGRATSGDARVGSITSSEWPTQ